MKISAVIATMNRPDDLKAALESLWIQTTPVDEIWVIDQSTQNQSKELVDLLIPRFASRNMALHYVYQEEKSLVKARNRGLGLVSGEIVSFLDDDIVLDADYFEKVAREFGSDEQLVGLSGNARVRTPWTGFKWGLRRFMLKFFLLTNDRGTMTPSGFGHPIYEREIDRVLRVEMLPGCNMNFRRGAIAGESFDEFFKGYSYREDAEFSYRISRKGPIRMIPDARLWHNYSTSSRLTEAQLKSMMIQNYHYVFRKFKKGDPVASFLFAYSLFGMIVMDFIEYSTNRTPQKKDKLAASWKTSLSLLRKA